MNHNQQESNKYSKRLVSNARAMITNQIALPLGAVKMNNLALWARQSGAFTDINLDVFEEYASQFNGCPVGTERLL